MSGSGPRPTFESMLRAAAPHTLVETVRSLLAKRVGASGVTVRLVDYGQTVLQAVAADPDPEQSLPARTGPAGRAFSGQEPVVEDTEIHVPITVRGDRLGVLSATLPSQEAARSAAEDLLAFAGALGHELAVADRDTDLFVRTKRRKRLTLAAEMQWSMLPGRGCERDAYTIGAHLEPAYAIGGDNFDWSGDAERLVLTVTDGMRLGMDAALLTGLAVSALRNARRAGLGVADQAVLADQAIFAQYRGEAYAATLLLEFELATGRVTAVDAGSPQLYRMRGGRVEQIALESQLPLGMFEDTPYTEQTFTVEPGDRLVAVSTGLYSPVSGTGSAFGERELARCVRASQLATPSGTAHALVDALFEHTGGAELSADASVVCLDWRGRPRSV